LYTLNSYVARCTGYCKLLLVLDTSHYNWVGKVRQWFDIGLSDCLAVMEGGTSSHFFGFAP